MPAAAPVPADETVAVVVVETAVFVLAAASVNAAVYEDAAAMAVGHAHPPAYQQALLEADEMVMRHCFAAADAADAAAALPAVQDCAGIVAAAALAVIAAVVAVQDLLSAVV